MRTFKLCIASAIVSVVVLFSAAPAFAQVSDQVIVHERVVTVPMWVYTLVTGWFIPILVGLVTKINAPAGIKILISLAFNAINGVIGTAVVIGGAAVFSINTILMAGLSLLTALATYAGIWKPLAIQTKLAPNAGIGPSNGG